MRVISGVAVVLVALSAGNLPGRNDVLFVCPGCAFWEFRPPGAAPACEQHGVTRQMRHHEHKTLTCAHCGTDVPFTFDARYRLRRPDCGAHG